MTRTNGPVAGSSANPTGSPTAADGLATTAPPPGSNRSSKALRSGISQVLAFDGLFLRAEHLNRIQSYARDLVYAAGQAGGAGVVYGFDVTLDKEKNTVSIGAGLAMSEDGPPLRSTEATEVSLADLTPTQDGYWVVTVVPDSTIQEGDASVFGVLCDDPCAGTASLRPFGIDGVRIDLIHTTEPGLFENGEDLRRGWLSSKLFERERQDPACFLDPSAALTTKNWRAGSPKPSGNGVPIAVLIWTDGKWQLDTWIARRERGDPPPKRHMQGRLGMRPWDVFTAQLLQFEDLLTARYTPAAATTMTFATMQQQLEKHIDSAMNKVKERKQKEPLAILATARSMVRGEAGALDAPKTFGALGFVDLPPAGFLPLSGSSSMEAQVADLFGVAVADLRFCRCRPDYVQHAIEQVQHMARIPLGTDGAPEVDILVPTPKPELGTSATTAYPWVAFVRRRELNCDLPAGDPVTVYWMETETGNPPEGVLNGETPAEDEAVLVAKVDYPAAAWAVPRSTEEGRVNLAALREDVTETLSVALVARASSEERRSLAGVRAALLVLEELGGLRSFSLDTVAVEGEDETIVAVLRKPDPKEPVEA